MDQQKAVGDRSRREDKEVLEMKMTREDVNFYMGLWFGFIAVVLVGIILVYTHCGCPF